MRLDKRFLSLLILTCAVRVAAAEPDLATFDQGVTALLEKHHIPGATVAVARNGKLVIARGYGLADREQKAAAQPDTLFRIASISKTLTSAAILKLIEEGRLTLDTKAFPLLDQFQPPRGKQADPRLAAITVRQLLHHQGGWDIAIADPLEMGPAAGSLDDIIGSAMGRPLHFDPGARFAYSNFGYEVLGRVIEKVARMPYEDYVKEAILAPIGVRRAQVGKAMLSQRAEGEGVYYDFPGAPLVWTANRGGPPLATRPYAFPLRNYDSSGAWIASAVDLVRFALAMDEQSGHPLLLEKDTLRQARADRVASWPGWTPPGGKREYALGWIIDTASDGAETWWHSGGLPGTRSILAHRPDGIVYAAIFNSGPEAASFGDLAASGDAYRALSAALDAVREWPEADLFEIYR